MAARMGRARVAGTSPEAAVSRAFGTAARAAAGAAEARHAAASSAAPQSGFRQLLKLDLQKDRRCIGAAHGTCYSGILALAGDRIVRGRANKAEAQKPDGARNVDGNRLLCDADLDGERRG